MPAEKPDEEKCLPRATVDKLIHELLLDGFTITKATREMLRDSCQLFLEMIAIEASRICEVEKKRTITNHHVYKSLEKHGFASYIDKCNTASVDYEEYSRHRPSRQNKFKESGKTLDELHEDQMRLFSAARKEINMEYGVEDNGTDESDS